VPVGTGSGAKVTVLPGVGPVTSEPEPLWAFAIPATLADITTRAAPLIFRKVFMISAPGQEA
jgi:hypothetical protein